MRHVVSAAIIATALAFGTGAQAQVPESYPADYAKIIEAAKKEGKVVIYATTDAVAANPLIKDFEALYPGIKVEYSDLNSTELYNRFIAEAAANNGTADVLWSSAMDLQVKLVADGQAATYPSPEIKALPKWAVWKDSAYGTTYEPIAFVYNKRLVPEGDVPKDHTDLLKLLEAKTDFYKGKITAYDPERSGVGYLFCNEDIKDFPQAWDLFKAMGKAQAKLYTSAGAMMERVTLKERSQSRHRPAEGLHDGDFARCLHFEERKKSERRQTVS
jgi:iron(III) transport system substrate-binding protein